MEEIRKWVHWQQGEYALFWLLALGVALLFEGGLLDEGGLVGQAQLEFMLETLTILLTLGMIPLALKLFTWRRARLRALPLLDALRAYHHIGLVRLLLLGLVVWGNLVLYYLTLNSIGGLCALLGCIASLFCVPGRRRTLSELEIEE